MSDDAKTPVEQVVDQALDVFVYAPIGLIFDGPTLFPKLVEKGRKQVTTARMVGELAVQQGQTEATKALARFHEQATGLLDLLGGADGRSRTPAPPPRSSGRPRPAPAATTAPKPPADGLAIPDYESLSASQVVSRLGGLERAELDAVRAYESATRGRKTVLNKIAQLQRS